MNEEDIRILVVDESTALRRTIRMILKRLGFDHIVEVGDGQKAFDRLKEGSFQLAISGWNAPPLTGLDLLKAIRTDEDLKGLPFLMVTPEAKEEEILDAVQAGVSNFIVKPFTEHVFSKKLDDILSN